MGNKILVGLNGVLLVAVAVLFYLYTTVSGGSAGATPQPTTDAPAAATPVAASGDMTVVYINIDSLRKNYRYYTDSEQELDEKTRKFKSELDRREAKFSKDATNADENIKRGLEGGFMTQTRAQEIQVQMQQRYQELQAYAAGVEQEMYKLEMGLNKEVQKSIFDFLQTYRSEKGYSLILGYQNTLGDVMSADPALDVTAEVVRGLNTQYDARSAEAAPAE